MQEQPAVAAAVALALAVAHAAALAPALALAPASSYAAAPVDALAFDLALVESTKYASSENESNHSETETEACKTSPDTDSDMESDEEFSEHTSMPYDTQSIATTQHNLGAFSFGFEDPMEDGRPDQGYFCGDASLPKFLGA